MRATKIGLLLLILAFGAVVETAWVVRRELDLGPLGCRVLRGKFYGPSFSYDEEAEVEVPPGTSLEVSNAFGSVRVIKGGPGEVRITLRKVVFRSTEDQARAFASRIHAQTTLKASVLRVSTNREEIEASRDGQEVGFETHLEIAVPADTPVIVRNEHGSADVRDVAQADVSNSFEPLRIQGVAGSVVATSRHGDVTISNVGGTLELSAQHGDVSVQEVTARSSVKVEHGDVTVTRVGDLVVEAAHGDVVLEDVRGNVTMRGQHSSGRARAVSGRLSMETAHGSLEVDGVKGDADLKADHGGVNVSNAEGMVSVHASFEDVSLSHVAGPIDVSVAHGAIRGQGLEKGGRIKSQGDDVQLDGFAGSFWIEAQRGSVRLLPSASLKDELTVSTTFGGIDLTVPAGSRFDLQAEAPQGDVSVELPGLTVTESAETRFKGSYEGGGINVKLTADHGEIRVRGPEKVTAAER